MSEMRDSYSDRGDAGGSCDGTVVGTGLSLWMAEMVGDEWLWRREPWPVRLWLDGLDPGCEVYLSTDEAEELIANLRAIVDRAHAFDPDEEDPPAGNP